MKGRLFTVSNPKTAKGEASGYLTIVLHLAPHDTAGRGTVCAMSTPECRALCLNTAGRGGIIPKGKRTNAIQRARKRRTLLYFDNRAAFTDALVAEVVKWRTYAQRKGLKLAARVNGTSDLPMLADAVAAHCPDVPFYDYTKIPRAALSTTSRVHRTFSRSENNEATALDVTRTGRNVAVVFSTRKGQPLPATFWGRRVIDGDAHDLRFLDPPGVVVGLRAKGKARKHVGGFVVDASKL